MRGIKRLFDGWDILKGPGMIAELTGYEVVDSFSGEVGSLLNGLYVSSMNIRSVLLIEICAMSIPD